jgi:predicted RNA binding protein YcfA (HicA-like mRNA interferase family)
MPKLPRGLSSDDVIKVFEKIGYLIDHQTGSHIILYPEAPHLPLLSIPRHKVIKVGLLRNLIRDAQMTVDDFCHLLKKV